MTGQPCRLCGAPGRKVRVQVSGWRYECIHICRGCEPRLNEAITAVRETFHKGGRTGALA